MVFAAFPGSRTAVEAAPQTIELALVGAQENPPVVGAGSGFVRLTFDDATKVITYSVTISGIAEGEVTAAHIHRGAAGVNGPIIYNLSTVAFTAVDGKITLTDADIADLKAGNLYVNAHSTKNPGGFARGQIYLTPEQPIRATMNAAAAAWTRKDVAAFLSYWTPNGLESEFGEPVDVLTEALGEFIGDPPITIGSVTNVQSQSATTATATVDLFEGNLVTRHLYSFIQINGMWKIDGGPIVDAPTPAGAATVPVQMREFAFVYDKSAVASGNFVFDATNTGAQFHEVALAKIPANADLMELLESEEDVPGFEFIGAVFAEPGDKAKMVFRQPLATGRYAMVCFIPDDQTGAPHAFLGMVSEFTVGSSTGGGIRPPSTGDAGLAETDSPSYALLLGGVLALVAGAGLALTTVRSRSAA